MPHGTPDWGLVGPKTTTFGLDDLGEHAVRLGSPHLWDRRGDVVIMDSFEQGMSLCFTATSGLGAAIALLGGEAGHGAFSVGVTAGRDDDRYALLQWQHGLFVASRLGLEFMFSIDEETWRWRWMIVWYDGVLARQCYISLDCQDWTLDYTDLGGAIVVFATGLQMLVTARPFHTGKVVVDFTDGTYVRFILDGQAFSLAGTRLYEFGSGVAPSVHLNAEHHATLGNNPRGIVDSVIVTQNEP